MIGMEVEQMHLIIYLGRLIWGGQSARKVNQGKSRWADY